MASIYVLGHHYQVAKNKHFHSLDKHDPIAAEKWRKEANRYARRFHKELKEGHASFVTPYKDPKTVLQIPKSV